MWELYLISRIGVIHGLFVAVTSMSIITAIACYIVSISTDDWSGEDVCNEWQKSKLRKFANKMFVVFGISILITAITPTKEEAYFIYGVGSTIDYIQSNPKAKQIPDKCIDALNRWVDNLNEKEEKE
jgi:hypothetical protein